MIAGLNMKNSGIQPGMIFFNNNFTNLVKKPDNKKIQDFYL